MQTESATPTATPWRFSLRTLFLLTLAAAIFVWIISRPLWDMDERLILGTWYLTIVSGIAWNHSRGWRNGWTWTALSGLIPATTALVFELWDRGLFGFQMYFESLLSDAAAIFVVAALTWLIAIRILSPGKLNDLPPLRRADAMQRRFAWVAAVGLILAIALVIASWQRGKTRWQEQVFSPLNGLSPNPDFEVSPLTELALSIDGKFLGAYLETDNAREQRTGLLRVWNIERRQPVELFNVACKDVDIVAFTGEGRLRLYGWGSNRPLRTLDAVSGREIAEQANVPAYAITLWVRNEFNEFLAASPDGDHILRALRTRDARGRQCYELSVMDPTTKTVQHTLGQVPFMSDIAISTTGYLVAVPNEHYGVDSTLSNLRTGESIALPWIVRWFSADERRAIGLESFRPSENRLKWLDDWVFQLPVTRHLWLHGIHERFVEFDTTTGKAIRRSQWINATHLENLTISKDGNVAAGSTWYGEVMIWRAP